MSGMGDSLDRAEDLLAHARAEVKLLRGQRDAAREDARKAFAQVAELLPYAWAGAEALDAWEPYGPPFVDAFDDDPYRGEPAEAMLARIKAGEFGEVPGA